MVLKLNVHSLQTFQPVEPQDTATESFDVCKDTGDERKSPVRNDVEVDEKAGPQSSNMLAAVTPQEPAASDVEDRLSDSSSPSGMSFTEEQKLSNDAQTTLKPSSAPQEPDLPPQSLQSSRSEANNPQEDIPSRSPQSLKRGAQEPSYAPTPPPISSMPRYEDYLSPQAAFDQQGFTQLNENFGSPSDDFVPTWTTILEPNSNPYGGSEPFTSPSSPLDVSNTQGGFAKQSNDFSGSASAPPTQGMPTNETGWYQRDLNSPSANPYLQTKVNSMGPTQPDLDLRYMQESMPSSSFPSGTDNGFFEEEMTPATLAGNVEPGVDFQANVSGEISGADTGSMSKGLQLLKEGRKAVLKVGECLYLLRH